MHRNKLIVAALMIACATGVLLWRSKTTLDYARVYRIGYGGDMPYHFQGADGKPTGLAVDMVAEAARRRGIKLDWRTSPTPGMPAIEKGEVDLWVLLAIRPERRKIVYLTEPYLSAETCFLVPASAGDKSVEDFAHARVAALDFDSVRRSLQARLPQAVLVPVASTLEAEAAVREGRAEAAFLDQYPATAALLADAGSRPMRMLISGAPPTLMGIGSNFATQDIADALRDELRSVASGRSLDFLARRWGFFSNRSTDAVAVVEAEKRRNRFLWAGIGLLLMVAVLAILLAVRLRRERNVAEARKAALEENQAKLKMIGDNTGDVIWVLDVATASFTYISPSVERLRGYSAEEAMRQTLEEALTPDSRRRLCEIMAIARAGFPEGDGGPHLITTEAVQQPRKDGSLVTTEVVTTLLTGSDGQVREILGVSRDVTQRLRAEQERHILEQQLHQAQRLESIGRLAGGIAHDFNNLLTVINGYSQLLLTRRSSDEVSARRLDQIHKAGRRAAGLTQQLLAFSRRQVIAARSVNLNTAVNETVGMLHRILGEDVRIETSLAADLGWALVDPDQMSQVIMNLVVNARDAMPHGGRVTLHTENMEVPADSPATPEMAPGRYILLAVSDTGEGMDSATLQSIFEPFFTTKERGRGTGLGLATVHGIVRQSAGWIKVESEPGKGSTFRIFLPRVEAAAEEAGSAASPEQPHAGGETILVTEDQDDVRLYLTEVLSSLGYNVLEAPSAEDAIRTADQYAGTIDLLLTDVVLPGMNGMQLAQKLCQERTGMKVLYASGYTDNAAVRSGVVHPGFAYLAKPFTADILAEKVREVLGRV